MLKGEREKGRKGEREKEGEVNRKGRRREKEIENERVREMGEMRVYVYNKGWEKISRHIDRLGRYCGVVGERRDARAAHGGVERNHAKAERGQLVVHGTRGRKSAPSGCYFTAEGCGSEIRRSKMTRGHLHPLFHPSCHLQQVLHACKRILSTLQIGSYEKEKFPIIT